MLLHEDDRVELLAELFVLRHFHLNVLARLGELKAKVLSVIEHLLIRRLELPLDDLELRVLHFVIVDQLLDPLL